jgi:glycerophosphoryl diester phosphodiesterase
VQQQRSFLPELVAHRGNAADFPENTLPALRSALEAGIPWVEIDVQLSADRVPFVLHDARLERTTRRCGDLRQLASREVDGIDAGEPRRFGDAFRGTPLPRLAEFAALLSGHPGSRAFIELKRASLEHHGRGTCLDRVCDALAGVLPRCVILSFDAATVAMARARGIGPVGWVIDRFDAAAMQELDALRPDYVFYDYLKVAPADAPLPAGPWCWAVYEVKGADRARREWERGAALVETMAPLRLRAELAATPAESG